MRVCRNYIVSQHILFDGMVVLRAVDLGDRDLRRVLVVALPALSRLLHFAHLALSGRIHYTVYVRHFYAFYPLSVVAM